MLFAAVSNLFVSLGLFFFGDFLCFCESAISYLFLTHVWNLILWYYFYKVVLEFEGIRLTFNSSEVNIFFRGGHFVCILHTMVFLIFFLFHTYGAELPYHPLYYSPLSGGFYILFSLKQSGYFYFSSQWMWNHFPQVSTILWVVILCDIISSIA